MGDIKLKGLLNLKGMLKFNSKVLVHDKEALVESIAPAGTPHCTGAPPVLIPPITPATPKPIDDGPKVWVINSFNKTVTANNKNIVAGGMAMQGNIPTWAGMVLPSQGNTGPVTINFIPINVVNDQAIIIPQGSAAVLSTSGQ